MADWRDVMNARSDADAARGLMDSLGSVIEDGGHRDPALATLLAADAICLELRALGMIIDQALGVHAGALGRP